MVDQHERTKSLWIWWWRSLHRQYEHWRWEAILPIHCFLLSLVLTRLAAGECFYQFFCYHHVSFHLLTQVAESQAFWSPYFAETLLLSDQVLDFPQLCLFWHAACSNRIHAIMRVRIQDQLCLLIAVTSLLALMVLAVSTVSATLLRLQIVDANNRGSGCTLSAGSIRPLLTLNYSQSHRFVLSVR